LRDDVAAGVLELCRLLAKKKSLLHRLLLSESDTIHYVKSENFERVDAILLEDESVIGEIDLVDCDIAKSEESLCRIIGIQPRELYEIIDGNDPRGRELVTLRDDIRSMLERLLRERNRLGDAMRSATREVREHIEGIARIRRLKLPVDE